MDLSQQLGTRLQMRLGLRMTAKQLMHTALLQATRMELQQKALQEIQINPMLEQLSDEPEPSAAELELKRQDQEVEHQDSGSDSELADRDIDSGWEEYLADASDTGQPPGPVTVDPSQIEYMMNSITRGETLIDHLIKQLHIVLDDAKKRRIGEIIIVNLEPDGYLHVPLEDIAGEIDTSTEEVEEVLDVIQSLDPPGIAARNLRECLMLQLREKKGMDAVHAWSLLKDHYDSFTKRRFERIMSDMKLDHEALRRAIAIIASLDRHPGEEYSYEEPEAVTPDVTIRKIDGKFEIIMNDDGVPNLRINRYYKKLLNADKHGRKLDRNTRIFLTRRLKSAIWLIQGIAKRRQTIRHIAEAILKLQKVFFLNGPAALKPMTLRDVADMIKMHESTVSRATANKHLQTDWGIFPFKKLFGGGVSSDTGDLAVATVKTQIKSMIDNEDPAKPLSDIKIMEQLASKGIRLARRTVAKYREAIGIPSSSARRRTL